MEKRLEELLEKVGTASFVGGGLELADIRLSIKEGLELVRSVYNLALGKDPDLDTKTISDIMAELKLVLVTSSDKEVVKAIQVLIELVEGSAWTG